MNQRIIHIFLINFFLINTSFGMLQRYAHKAMTKEVASKFTMSLVERSPETVKTLIAYNIDTRNKLAVRFFLSSPVALVGSAYCFYSSQLRCWQIGLEHITGSFLGIASAVYCPKMGRSVCHRQWMTNRLHQVKNNRSNAFDKSYSEAIIQDDIAHNIRKINIVLAEETALEYKPSGSYLRPITEITPVLKKEAWDVNKNETLGNLLRGKYNSSEYTLYISN